MHTPSTEPRFSLYYNYQVYQPWLASQHGHWRCAERRLR